MMILTLMAAIVLIGLMIRHASGTAEDYRRLKMAETPSERIAFYRRRLVKSVRLFGFGGLILLACSGGIGGLAHFPARFAPAARWAREQDLIGVAGFADLPHFIVPIMVGMTITALFTVLRPKAKAITVGDIGAILPRNAREIGWGALISFNAGISEELCFRLAVPFALTVLLGNAVWAFAAATLLFGFLHRYQGPIGIAFTTALGGILAIQYLATGNLLLVVVIHAGFNLMAMVFRPIMILLLTTIRNHFSHPTAITGNGIRQ